MVICTIWICFSIIIGAYIVGDAIKFKNRKKTKAKKVKTNADEKAKIGFQ